MTTQTITAEMLEAIDVRTLDGGIAFNWNVGHLMGFYITEGTNQLGDTVYTLYASDDSIVTWDRIEGQLHKQLPNYAHSLDAAVSILDEIKDREPIIELGMDAREGRVCYGEVKIYNVNGGDKTFRVGLLTYTLASALTVAALLATGKITRGGA